VAGLSFLADACALIMFHGRSAEGMTDTGRSVMEEGDVFVSPITVWEITRKVSLGKLIRPVPADYSGDFSAWLSDAGYRMLPLSWSDCERANSLPDLHKDPMDRMLIAAALGHDMTIVTNDRLVAVWRSHNLVARKKTPVGPIQSFPPCVTRNDREGRSSWRITPNSFARSTPPLDVAT